MEKKLVKLRERDLEEHGIVRKDVPEFWDDIQELIKKANTSSGQKAKFKAGDFVSGYLDGHWEDCEILYLNMDSTVVIKWLSNNVIEYKQKKEHLRTIKDRFKEHENVMACYGDDEWRVATVHKANGDGTYVIQWGYDSKFDCEVPESSLRRAEGLVDFIVRVDKANDLPDRVSTYVKIEMGCQKFQTKPYRASSKPIWNETFEFTCEPESFSKIIFKVFESGVDREIGDCELRMESRDGSLWEDLARRPRRDQLEIVGGSRGRSCGWLSYELEIIPTKKNKSIPIEDMSVREVIEQVLSRDLRDHARIFERNEIDGLALLKMVERGGDFGGLFRKGDAQYIIERVREYESKNKSRPRESYNERRESPRSDRSRSPRPRRGSSPDSDRKRSNRDSEGERRSRVRSRRNSRYDDVDDSDDDHDSSFDVTFQFGPSNVNSTRVMSCRPIEVPHEICERIHVKYLKNVPAKGMELVFDETPLHPTRLTIGQVGVKAGDRIVIRRAKN